MVLNNHRILKRLAKALIRLRVRAGWSEALLVAHTTLLEISCTGLYYSCLMRLVTSYLRHIGSYYGLCKALIRLRVRAGWSEALLVAHTTLLEISCTGLYYSCLMRLVTSYLRHIGSYYRLCIPQTMTKKLGLQVFQTSSSIQQSRDMMWLS